jgi:hypothetical protein
MLHESSPEGGILSLQGDEIPLKRRGLTNPSYENPYGDSSAKTLV